MSRRRQHSPLILWVRGVLNHFVTRLVLSLAIIFSLLPLDRVERLNALFFAIFGLEFLARVVLLFRAELHADDRVRETEGGWTKPRPHDVVLLLLDLVALVSFVPISAVDIAATRWLRLFRLTRMLMLLKYWAPLARDLWSVSVRRERLRQVVLMGIVVLILSFAGAVILDHATHGLQVDFDGDGDIDPASLDGNFWVRLWWAFRQIQDPGNMLATPNEALVLAVSIALTVFGLFLVSFLIGLGTDVVRELMELSRLRSPGLRNHTVVVNITPSTRQLLFELIRHYRKLVAEGTRLFSFSGARELLRNAARRRNFLIVGRTYEPPDFLREPEFARIVYRESHPDDEDEAFLERTDITAARRVLIFGDADAEDPDDETIRLLLTVVERLPSAKPTDKKRKLIAEVFDESNILAARKAIEPARGRLQAYIVPTERLLALFIACVARRTGIAGLLVELLTSKGHELYTYEYRHEASGSTAREPPRGFPDAAETLARLHAFGVARTSSDRVVPVGILVEPRGHGGPMHAMLNPHADDFIDGAFAGFVAVAPNFRVVNDFAHQLAQAGQLPEAPPVAALTGCPELVRGPTTDLRRVLVCGFRSASVNMIEALVTSAPDTEVLILVPDEDTRREVLDDFDSYTRLVESEMLSGHRGTFAPTEEHSLCYRPAGKGPRCGRIWVEVGNWTSSRRLMRLPRDFGSVGDVSAVVLISDGDAGSDARTATALMKIEALVDHQRARAGGPGPQRIVAEVLDAELARRLIRRYAHLDKTDVRVFSIQELRAYFMFQAVVVPHFDLVYGELMAPWGQSLVQLVPASEAEGTCSFAELAAYLRARHQLLVALEMQTSEGPRLFVGEGDLDEGERVDLSRIVHAWVIDDDQPAGERVDAATGP